MLDACTPQTRIVDGWEGAYTYKRKEQFQQAYESITNKLAAMAADPEKYRRHFTAGFGIWMDCNWRGVGWHTDDLSKNFFKPAEFETSVRLGLQATDEYVWIYTEQPRWWTNEKLPKEYVEALVKARHKKEARGHGSQTRVLMVTSFDPPLSKLTDAEVRLLNDTPFDGVAISLFGIYDGGPLPNEAALLARCAELRRLSNKPIWPRVYLNRMIGFLPTASRRTACFHPEYFDRIKGFDLWNEAGARDDFLTLWRLALRAAKALGSPGIVADLESYNCGGLANPTTLAHAAGRSLAETQSALEAIGAEMADIAAKEYPEAIIWSLFTLLGRPDWFKAGNVPLPALHAYIFKGMLERAQSGGARFRLISGGEDHLGYYSATLDALRQKIVGGSRNYERWLKRFGQQLELGGTITIWNDDSRLTGWVRQAAGSSSPFKRFADFEPFLTELFRSYRHVWLYVPMCTDYNPFDATTAPSLNRELRQVLERSRKAAEKATTP